MENNRIDRPTTKRYKSGHRYVACVTRGGRQRAGPNGDSHDIRHFPQDPKGHPLAASRVLHKILINVTTKWWEPHWPRQIYGLHFDECAGKVFKAWRKLKFLVPIPQGAPNIFLLILAWKPPGTTLSIIKPIYIAKNPKSEHKHVRVPIVSNKTGKRTNKRGRKPFSQGHKTFSFSSNVIRKPSCKSAKIFG